MNETVRKVMAAMSAKGLARTSVENVEDVLEALARMPSPDPVQLLEIARATGLRGYLHGVNATDARELLSAFVAAVRAASQPPAPVVAAERPDGAIHNAAAYANMLENIYDFECEAGPLRHCYEWIELRRCLNVLADYVDASPAAAPDAAHAQQDAAPSDTDEAMELLDSLIASIEEHGNYSKESTLTFLNQIKQCIAAPAASAPSDATGKAELRVIKFALELAENENDDAAVSFLKAWNNKDAGYLRANWPDFDAKGKADAANAGGLAISDDDICAFQHAIQQLEWIASGTTPDKNCDLGYGPNKATIRHAMRHADSALNRVRPAYARLLDAFRDERRSSQCPATSAADAKDAERWTKTPPTEQADYWNWDGDPDHAPMIYHVLWSGTAKKCFVSIGQYDIKSAIWCDEFGGWWLKIEQPSIPAAQSSTKDGDECDACSGTQVFNGGPCGACTPEKGGV